MQSRRTFLKNSAVALAGATIIPAAAFGANERLNIAFIGAGGRATRLFTHQLKNHPLLNMVAFADVDDVSAATSYKTFPDVPRYRDFREMLDKHERQIDGVIITTPDHGHHYQAKWCMNMGKPVYLEKPLTRTIQEAEDLMAMERETGLVCQMGNQGHSSKGLQELNAWIRHGILGEILECHAFVTMDYYNPAKKLLPEEPVPGTLDWDLWLGPQKFIPYNPAYCPRTWRKWFPFGGGALGDWVNHNMDAPYYALGLDCPSKIEIESTGPKKGVAFPDSAKITYTFPLKNENRDLKFYWYQGETYKPPVQGDFDPFTEVVNSIYGGTLIIGSKASVLMNSHAGTPRIIPEKKHLEMASSLPEVEYKERYQRPDNGHYDNWLNALKGLEKPNSDFAYGGRLTQCGQFGNIALNLDCNLEIDPVKKVILNNEEAASSELVGYQPREGWGSLLTIT